MVRKEEHEYLPVCMLVSSRGLLSNIGAARGSEDRQRREVSSDYIFEDATWMNEGGLHGSETTIMVYKTTERHATGTLMRNIGDETLRS